MNSQIKQIIKEAIKNPKHFPYHIFHKIIALRALKNIEKQKGKLSKNIASQCDKYAIEHLGSKKYAPWLYVYSAIQGQFKEGWMPDNYYGEVIVYKRDQEFSRPCNLKALSNRLLNTKKLPDLLYYNNSVFFEPNEYRILSYGKASDLLFNGRDSVIFKSDDSSQGRGVRFFSKAEWANNSETLTNGVFQKIINQHSFFNEIFPHPGATIRITTALNSSGAVSSRAAYLRLGRSNVSSSSKHVQSHNAVKVAINLDTGTLFSTGYTPDWQEIESHPDTNVPFKGLVIPSFNKACREIEKLHTYYPFVQCIGWDISINNDEEVEVMEWNAGHNDIKFSEAIHGPNFMDLLSYVNSSSL